MKKILFKRLQSLTAILVLNTVPVSFAQTSTSFATQSISSSIPVDERRQSFGKKPAQDTALSQLYFQHSLAYIQKNASPSVLSSNTHQYHMALAMVEEAYQDHFDDVLDTYEKALNDAAQNQDPNRVKEAKLAAEKDLAQLKVIRKQKVDEFSRQFGVA